MCNVCGCREAEDESPKKKYRTPNKKQRQTEDEAMMDVDYMRDSYQTEFEAMERFPAGDHDVNICIALLRSEYPGIEINDYTYLIQTSGSANKYHVFIETSEGNFNLYGRIGYGNPKMYGPMGYGQYHKKVNQKIRKGYGKKSAMGAEDEGESHDYTPESYDPLTESPESYDPMSESYSAEEDQDHDYTPESYDPLSENPESYDPMSESYSAHGCGCGVSSCSDCSSACGCTCMCAEDFLERYEAPRKSSGRKRRYGKRQRFDHIKGNSRYLARDAKGRWISNVGVSGSIRQDLRNDAKTQQPRNFRGLGDAKVHHAEDGMLTNATIQWEDGFGTSSPSSPPRDIMWAEEEYTEDYPQNSAQIDGVTGSGVPVSYGSGSSQYVEPPVRMGAEEGVTYTHEDFIPNSYGGDSALTSGRGVPVWYGSAETFGADIVLQGKGSGLKSCTGKRKDGSDCVFFVPKDSNKTNCGHCDLEIPKGLGPGLHQFGAETFFEAPMQRFPPGKSDVDTAKALLRRKHRGIRFSGSPVYLVDRRGSANKFHVFLDSNKGAFNVYGRIGYPNPQVFGPMGEGIYLNKMRNKIIKGYKKTKFSAEANFPGISGAVDDGYYPNSWGEDSASISGQGVPQWYGSAEEFNAQGYSANGQRILLMEPIQTGAKFGFGFILASAGSVIAATALGMLLGD